MRRAVVGAGVLAAGAAVALAAAGDLDLSFGTDGVAVTTAGTNAGQTAVVALPGGKTLLGGSDNVGSTHYRWRVRQFDAAGNLDGGFGSGGLVTLFGTDGNGDSLSDLALDASGNIVACGSATFVTTSGNGKKQTTTTWRGATVARLLPSGALDTSFGSGGSARIEIPSPGRGVSVNSTAGNAVAVQSDGKIVVAGTVYMSSKSVSYSAYFVARLTSAGALDTSFGSGGTSIHDPTAGDDTIYPGSIALQSTGKFVVGGRTFGSGQALWDITRFNADGTHDSGFATIRDASQMIRGILVDGSDRIVACGARVYAQNVADVVVARYTPDGAPDTTFGSGGSTAIDFSVRDEGAAVALQSDGRIVFTAGTWQDSPGDGPADGLVGRLTSSGELDTSFGTGGLAGPYVLGQAFTALQGVAIASDGKIVAGGLAIDDSPNAYRWILLRLLAN